MEEIIITGATGFIGRNLIKEMVNVFPKENILCLIRDKVTDLEITGRKVLEELKLKTKEIDLSTGSGLNNLPKNPKIIIHLAASTESGDADHSCNDIGTKNLLEAFSPVTPETNFIFTSTAAIYSGRNDLHKPVDEKTVPVASNEYGRSKIRAEEILKEYISKYGFSATIFRLGTVWGENTRKNGLFDSLKKLIPKKSVIPRLNWPGRTSLIHVDDVSRIILYFSKNKSQKPVQTFVLSHEALTMTDISKVLHRNLNVPFESFNLPDIFWNASKKLIHKSYLFDNILPSKTYNTFWRLNLIMNDTLYCKPDEIVEKVPELNFKMKDFSEYK